MTPPADLPETDLDAAWAAYGRRYPGLRTLIEQTVRRTFAECDTTREARLNARAEVVVSEMREGKRLFLNPPYAPVARRGAAAPASGAADPFHADLEPQNDAESA